MSNPTPDQIQAMKELITELLGWTDHTDGCDFENPPTSHPKVPHWDIPNEKTPQWPGYIYPEALPNWPGDRRESYELLKDYNINFKSSAVISAYDESMIFIELKGYRWDGEQFVKEKP